MADLHYTIQIAVGWSDTHLNRFHIHGKDFGFTIAADDFADDPEQVPLSASDSGYASGFSTSTPLWRCLAA